MIYILLIYYIFKFENMNKTPRKVTEWFLNLSEICELQH